MAIARAIAGTPLLPGTASGPVLRLDQPISFWGGVDPHIGKIVDPRHPQFGSNIVETMMLIPSTIGSSSSSSVLLELIAQNRAPAALALGKRDAILCLGAVVARTMGWHAPPIVEISAIDQRHFSQEDMVWLTEDGHLQETPGA